MKTFPNGIYLVIDPSMDTNLLIEGTEQALLGGVAIVQIWNNWPDYYTLEDKIIFINQVLNIAQPFKIPVLINEEWKLACETDLTGIHFDEIPQDINAIKTKIKRPIYTGITCGNNRDKIKHAKQIGIDYISFCSMFPSQSVDTCEIVNPENIVFARQYTSLPIFISGGITPANASKLKGCGANGIAVISGILNSSNPKKAAENYKIALNNF